MFSSKILNYYVRDGGAMAKKQRCDQSSLSDVLNVSLLYKVSRKNQNQLWELQITIYWNNSKKQSQNKKRNFF